MVDVSCYKCCHLGVGKGQLASFTSLVNDDAILRSAERELLQVRPFVRGFTSLADDENYYIVRDVICYVRGPSREEKRAISAGRLYLSCTRCSITVSCGT